VDQRAPSNGCRVERDWLWRIARDYGGYACAFACRLSFCARSHRAAAAARAAIVVHDRPCPKRAWRTLCAGTGIDPARIVNVNIRHPRDLSFVLEEAARLSSLAAIIAEGPLPSFTASRRLALLLASSGVPLLFLPDGKTVQGSAAVTRLLVSPLTAPDHALDIRAPGPPAFRVTLARHRGGRPGLSFETVFDHANLTFTPLAFTPLSGDQPDGFPDRQFSMASAPERQRSA
jgi:hypothetical protein